MFDLAFFVALVIAIARAARARVTPAIVLGGTSLTLLVVASAATLRSRSIAASMAGALGLAFLGPTAVAVDREGPTAFLAHPLSNATLWLASTAAGALLCHYRARDLHPDSAEARRLHSAELAFIGACTFAAVRLVSALLFLFLAREP